MSLTPALPFNIEALVRKYNLSPDAAEILEGLRIDQSQQEEIANYDQRTQKWHDARENRLTGSVFGAGRGHCQYTSRNQLLKSMLWKTFKQNAAMEYGTKNEPVAVSKYTEFMRRQFNLDDTKFQVTHTGLMVSVEHPWLGVSVDGFVFDDSEPEHRKRGGLEIKCPFGRKLYPFIPSMYYDQIQGSMGLLGLPWWDFVVYTPYQTQIRRVEFDPLYWSQELFPRLEEFYMTQYLPRAVLKKQGKLRPGKIDPILSFDVSESDSDQEPEPKSVVENTLQNNASLPSKQESAPIDTNAIFQLNSLLR